MPPAFGKGRGQQIRHGAFAASFRIQKQGMGLAFFVSIGSLACVVRANSNERMNAYVARFQTVPVHRFYFR